MLDVLEGFVDSENLVFDLESIMSTQRDLLRVRIIFAHVEPCLHMPTQLKNKFALLFAFLQFVNLFNC